MELGHLNSDSENVDISRKNLVVHRFSGVNSFVL